MREDVLKQVVEDLVGPGALAYALHADGSLTVVDARGWKRQFTPADYHALCRKRAKTPKRSME
jgi:hypothetical protein